MPNSDLLQLLSQRGMTGAPGPKPFTPPPITQDNPFSGMIHSGAMMGNQGAALQGQNNQLQMMSQLLPSLLADRAAGRENLLQKEILGNIQHIGALGGGEDALSAVGPAAGVNFNRGLLDSRRALTDAGLQSEIIERILQSANRAYQVGIAPEFSERLLQLAGITGGRHIDPVNTSAMGQHTAGIEYRRVVPHPSGEGLAVEKTTVQDRTRTGTGGGAGAPTGMPLRGGGGGGTTPATPQRPVTQDSTATPPSAPGPGDKQPAAPPLEPDTTRAQTRERWVNGLEGNEQAMRHLEERLGGGARVTLITPLGTDAEPKQYLIEYKLPDGSTHRRLSSQ